MFTEQVELSRTDQSLDMMDDLPTPHNKIFIKEHQIKLKCEDFQSGEFLSQVSSGRYQMILWGLKLVFGDLVVF